MCSAFAGRTALSPDGHVLAAAFRRRNQHEIVPVLRWEFLVAARRRSQRRISCGQALILRDDVVEAGTAAVVVT